MVVGVPQSARDSAPDGVELSVIVPCYNEELNVPAIVARLLGVFETGGVLGEVVLVDDGSSDQARRRQSGRPRRRGRRRSSAASTRTTGESRPPG